LLFDEYICPTEKVWFEVLAVHKLLARSFYDVRGHWLVRAGWKADKLPRPRIHYEMIAAAIVGELICPDMNIARQQ
jgi:hypothetical protein